MGIAVAADGAAWFTDSPARAVSRIAADGALTSFALTDTPIARLNRLALAPDGAVWFADSTALSVTRLRNGVFTPHVLASLRPNPYGVAVDARGTVWATLPGREQARPHHARRPGHRDRDPDARERAVGHRGGSGRRRVVPRVPQQQDRALRRRPVHRVSGADAERGADRPGRRARRRGVVRRAPGARARPAARRRRSRSFPFRARTRARSASPSMARATSGTRTCTGGSASSPPSARGPADEAGPLIGLELPGRLNELAVIFVSIVLAVAAVRADRRLRVGPRPAAPLRGALTRWLPQRRLAVVLLASGFGFVAPVCDCGVIPLARRLGAKGLPAYAATTFILAAPVVNPVVLALDGVRLPGQLDDRRAPDGDDAERGHRPWAWPRAPAVRRRPCPAWLRTRASAGTTRAAAPGLRGLVEPRRRRVSSTSIFFIVLGALFTAVAQTFVPRGDLAAIGRSRIGSVSP